MTEERESQGFLEAEKVYPNPGAKLITRIAILMGSIIGIVLGALLRLYAVQICEWLWDVALIDTVNNFRNLGLGMIIAFSVILVVSIIVVFAGYSLKEIVLSQEGITFKRKRNSIVIQKVTDVKEAGRGRILKLTGLSSEGKTLKKRVSWADVDKKRWQEFKQDIQKIQSDD
ncbi:hypothetical protein ES703_38331 [subsurface metagenome]